MSSDDPTVAAGSAATQPARPRALGGVLLLAALLVGLEAFVLRLGLVGMLVAGWLVLVSLPLTLLARHAGHRRQRLRDLAIYLVAALAAAAIPHYERVHTERLADDIVVAVKAYRAANGHEPDALQQLVPAYIESIPSGSFRYWRDAKGAQLMYVVMPPFGRRAYSFADDKWSELD